MPDLGTKRTCISCNAHFYDMNKKTVVCPKCHTEQAAEAFVKQKAAHYKASAKEAQEEDEIASLLMDAEGFDTADSAKADQDMDVLEDASDLGSDDHDIAEVFDNIDKLDLTKE